MNKTSTSIFTIVKNSSSVISVLFSRLFCSKLQETQRTVAASHPIFLIYENLKHKELKDEFFKKKTCFKLVEYILFIFF